MTEIDIMRDLDCCANKACNSCTRQGVVGCSDELAKSAATIIKMQQEAMQSMSKDVVCKIEENKAMSECIRWTFTKEELVGKINDIISASITHGGDAGGAYGSDLDGLVHKISNLLYKIDKENELVIVIERGEVVPKICFANKAVSEKGDYKRRPFASL